MNNYPGKLITLEGIDGSGKSTQSAMLFYWLLSNDSPVNTDKIYIIPTKEPGGTKPGYDIQQTINKQPNLSPTAELLLYAADRAQHVATVIRPALEAGHIVLCDRYEASTWAYQHAAKGCSEADVNAVDLVVDAPTPDLTIWLDVPVDIAMDRLEQRGDNAGSADLLLKAREGYGQWYDMAALNHQAMVCIDGKGSVEEIHECVLATVLGLFLPGEALKV